MKTNKTRQMSKMDKPIAETPLHQTAHDELMKLTLKDIERLIAQARITASARNAPLVLSNHIKEAHALLSKRSNDNKVRDAVLIFGSTFLGAFLPGFIESVQNENIDGIVIWVIIGLIGTMLIMFGLWGMK